MERDNKGVQILDDESAYGTEMWPFEDGHVFASKGCWISACRDYCVARDAKRRGVS